MARRLITPLDELYERVKDRYSAIEIIEILNLDNPSFIDTKLKSLIKKKIQKFDEVLEDEDYADENNGGISYYG